MTGEDMVKALGITDTFDWALPQPWVEETVEHTGFEHGAVCRSFVWLYDCTFGRPFALTTVGNRILAKLHEEFGPIWPLNPNPLYYHEVMGPINRISLDLFMAQFDVEIRGQIAELFAKPYVKAIVLYENQNMSSPHLGERTALVVGEGCTRPNMEAVEKDRLGEVPSVFQYPVAYVPKAGSMCLSEEQVQQQATDA